MLYDTAGRRTKQGFHSDNRTGYLNLDTTQSYSYDPDKKWLSEISRDGSTSESATYTYDPANGRLTRMDYGNGAHVEYTYYASGAVKKISHRSATNVLIASIEYDYDLAGNVLSVVLDDSLQYNGDATVSYQYDNLHRLTRETCVSAPGSSRQGYDYWHSYDAVGNRTARGGGAPIYYSYSPRNELTRVTEGDYLPSYTNYYYDLRGNPTGTSDYQFEEIWNEETQEWEYIEVYTGGRGFSWSSDDKLTKVEFHTYDAELDEDVLTKTVEYKYDLLGRRVAKRVTYADQEPGPWRWYFYDGLKVIAEGTGQNDKMYYTNSPGAIGGIICRDASTGGGQKLWYHFDRLGNVMAVTDANGNPYAVYTMEAFGNIFQVGTSTGYGYYYSQSDPQPYHITTKEYDPDCQLYYFNARWYDPTTGRYLSREPSEVDGPHLYHFNFDDPINWFDPNGEFSISWWWDDYLGKWHMPGPYGDPNDYGWGDPLAFGKRPPGPGTTAGRVCYGIGCGAAAAAVGVGVCELATGNASTVFLGPGGTRVGGLQNPNWWGGKPFHIDIDKWGWHHHFPWEPPGTHHYWWW